MSKDPEEARRVAALAAREGRDIDTSDLPEEPAAVWRGAVRGRFYREHAVRLDPDIAAWLEREGGGHQARVNAILRAAMTAGSDKS
jgi:uncharacterized protein (DUF4415 family)